MTRPAIHRQAPPPWTDDPAVQRVMAALDGGRGDKDLTRFVGGCVRDTVLGLRPRDVDLATRLRPQEALRRLREAGLETRHTAFGMAHGLVKAVAEELSESRPVRRIFEITTLRRDLYRMRKKGRRTAVAFCDDWGVDARRRDFTLNALYMDAKGTVHDWFGGVADARRGRIRFIGSPARRLAEDPLRLLRFLRFHATHGRAPPTRAEMAALADAAPSLSELRGKRAGAEVMRLLAADNPLPALRLMAACDAFAHLSRAGPMPVGEADLARLAAHLNAWTEPADRLGTLLASLPMETISAHGRALGLGPGEMRDMAARAQAVSESI